MNTPLVSIIIPARNAQSTMRKCLDSVFNLNYPNYEIIVINDGSTDNTAKILSGYNNIKVLITAGEGPSKARNTALKEARGEFIAFTDSDCIVDAEWLTELLKGFTDEKVGGVGGIQKVPEDDSAFGKAVQEFLSLFGFISDYMKSDLKMRQTNHNPTCNVMYRKALLLELGGFLVNLWPGEDVEIDYRIRKRGYRLMFNPKAVVFHYRVDNFSDYSRMMFRYGCAQGQLVRKYGFFRRIHFLPVFIFIFGIFLGYNIFLGLLISLLFLIWLFGIALTKSRNPILLLRLFFITVFMWNIGFLKGLAKK